MSTAALASYYRFHARVYDSTRWAFLFGRAELIRAAARHSSPARILEIGCGTGTNLVALARAFPEARITGLDLSADMLAKARVKTAGFGGRVSLIESPYRELVSEKEPFDLIVFSYCLTMINPGFESVMRLALRDLGPHGTLAITDFDDTGFGWFRRWMALNHVRMDGQIRAALRDSGLDTLECEQRPAYGGLWRWLLYVGRRRGQAPPRMHAMKPS